MSSPRTTISPPRFPRLFAAPSPIAFVGLMLSCVPAGAGCAATKKGESPAARATTASAAPAADTPEKPTGSESSTDKASEQAKTKEPITCEPKPTTVTFHMPGLEAEVRRKLAKPEGDLKPSELAKVKSVNLTSAQVDDLDPCVFPLLKGMKDLFLGKGELSDLSPLSTLNGLVSLRATDNEVVDASPLAGMTKMDRLDLSKSKVKDIGFVAKMTELTELTLDETEVSDLSPLAKCTKLEKLSVKGTRVKDVTPLAGLKKLRNLWLEGTPTTETSALAPLVGKGLKVTF